MSTQTAKTSVSAEDQQEINEFARVHKRLTEAKVGEGFYLINAMFTI